MVIPRKIIFSVRLLTIMLLVLAGCGTGNKNEQDAGPDLAIEDVAEMEVETDIIRPDPSPVILASLVPADGEGCPCSGQPGWCTTTSDKTEIMVKVKVNEVEDPNNRNGILYGNDVVKQVELVWLAPEAGTEPINKVSSTIGKEDEDGFVFYRLEFNYKNHIKPRAPEVGDGLYKLLVRVSLDDDLLVKKTLPARVVFDSTAPEITIDQPHSGDKYVASLPVSYCVTDTDSGGEPASGVAIEHLHFYLGETEIFPPEAEDIDLLCPASPIVFDVARANTETTSFRIVASDCLGSSDEVVVEPVKIVGLPDYEVPKGTDIPEDLGDVQHLQPAHLVFDAEHTPADSFPDLVIHGSQGIGFAHNPADGSANVGTIIPVLTSISAVESFVADVNGDKASDIITLETATTEDGTPAMVIRLFLQNTKEVLEEKPEPGTKVIEDYIPLGTFPEVPSEEHMLVISQLHLMHIRDVDLDGFADIVLSGTDEELCLALFRHTGKQAATGVVDLVPDPPAEEDDPPPEDDDADSFFTLHDTMQGVTGITDMKIGHFYAEAGDSRLDLVLTRPAVGLLTVISFDEEYYFNSGQDSIYCWANAELIAHRPPLQDPSTDLYYDTDLPEELEELLVYVPDTKGLHFIPSKGNGTFTMHASNYLAKLNPDQPTNKPVSVCIDANKEVDTTGFGLNKVASVTLPSLLEPRPRAFGLAVSLGDTPDSLLLTNLVGPPETPGDKDAVLDIIASVPGMNYIAIYHGNSYGGSYDGMFTEGIFYNPGQQPRALTIADFDQNATGDIACIVDYTREDGQDIQQLVLLPLNKDTNGQLYPAPREIPMPLPGTWTSGRLKPTHLVVADVQTDGDRDIIVAVEPVSQNYGVGIDGGDWEGQFSENMTTVSLPLIFTFLMQDGHPILEPPHKSAADISFTESLSGLAVGKFNDDDEPDLVMTVQKAVSDACSGRTFDILIGGRRVTGINDPLEIGKSSSKLDFYTSHSNSAGYFLPAGGFMGLQRTTGVLTARLNQGDDLDDLVLFAEEHSSPGKPDYQPDTIATFLTRYDLDWNDCGTKKMVWFDKAAPYHLKAPPCTLCGGPPPPSQGEEQSYICQPSFDFPDKYPELQLAPGQARPTDKTTQYEAGANPVAGTLGDFADSEGEFDCIDIMVATSGTHNVTYVRGLCDLTTYKFEDPIEQKAVGTDPVGVRAADLDQDGQIDAAVAAGGNVRILWGMANGDFEKNKPIIQGDEESFSPTSLVVEDVNNDEWDDVLVTSGSLNRILVYLNGGEREFFGPFALPTGVKPKQILVGQLDNDGCKDVAVLNEGSRTVTLLRNRRCD
jgi:hypothetical protein